MDATTADLVRRARAAHEAAQQRQDERVGASEHERFERRLKALHRVLDTGPANPPRDAVGNREVGQVFDFDGFSLSVSFRGASKDQVWLVDKCERCDVEQRRGKVNSLADLGGLLALAEGEPFVCQHCRLAQAFQEVNLDKDAISSVWRYEDGRWSQ